MGITGGGLVVGYTRDAAKVSGGQVCSIAKAKWNIRNGPFQAPSPRIDVEVTYQQQASEHLWLITFVKCCSCCLQGKMVLRC